MKRWIALLTFSAVCAAPAHAIATAQGWCELGNQTVAVQGYISSANTPAQRSYPGCTVTVYVTGSSGTLATLYADNNGTGLANPFTADSYGRWFFYASGGYYDVSISDGGMPTPYTFGAIDAVDTCLVGKVLSKVLVQVADVNVPNAQVMGALGTGIVKNTAGSGVQSIAVGADLPPMIGDSGSGGTRGAVPAPPAGSAAGNEFLSASGTWGPIPILIGDSGSGGTAGEAPAPPAGSAVAGKFLSADGTWAVPSGGGGSCSNCVTLNTVQTIVAAKTFTAGIAMAGSDVEFDNGHQIRFKDTSGSYQITLTWDSSNNVDVGPISGSGGSTYLWAGGYPIAAATVSSFLPNGDFTKYLGDGTHRWLSLSVGTVDVYGSGGPPNLELLNPTISQYVNITLPATVTTSYTLTLPPAPASAGNCLGTTGAGSTLYWVACAGGGGSLPVLDSTAIVEGSADNTKQMKFSVAGLTTGTTRTLTVPDANITLTGLENTQTFTGQKTFSTANVLIAGSIEIQPTTDFGPLLGDVSHRFGELYTGHVGLYNGGYYVELSTDASPSSSYNLTFPPVAASSASCLGTSGAGSSLSWVACSGGGGGSLPAIDSTSIVEGSSDSTKQMRFSVAGLTTGNTRVMTVPDSNMTLAGLENAQTFTGAKTFSNSDVVLSGVGLDLDNNKSIRFRDTVAVYRTTLTLDSSGNVDVGAITGSGNAYLWAGGYSIAAATLSSFIPAGDFTKNLGDGTHRWLSLSTGNIDIYGNGGPPNLELLNPTSGQYVDITLPATVTTGYTLTLPAGPAPSGSQYCLGIASGGGGTLTWVQCTP
jgi:hypothetical protein